MNAIAARVCPPGALDRVLPILLDPSVFVQNKAEAFCVAYLSGNIEAPKVGQFLDTALGEAHLKRRKRSVARLLTVSRVDLHGSGPVQGSSR